MPKKKNLKFRRFFSRKNKERLIDKEEQIEILKLDIYANEQKFSETLRIEIGNNHFFNSSEEREKILYRDAGTLALWYHEQLCCFVNPVEARLFAKAFGKLMLQYYQKNGIKEEMKTDVTAIIRFAASRQTYNERRQRRKIKLHTNVNKEWLFHEVFQKPGVKHNRKFYTINGQYPENFFYRKTIMDETNGHDGQEERPALHPLLGTMRYQHH